ncbi:hypothetical protein IWQ57_003998, partial [Coemansia nantahalensis]
MHAALRRACVCALRGGPVAARSPARFWCQSAAARAAAPTHADTVSAAIRDVIVGPASAAAQGPGRRRPRSGAPRATGGSEDSADAELAWQQQHTGHQRIRDSLDASLKCELRRGDPDQTHRHILVRELVAAIRSLGAGRLSEALDGSDSAQAPVVAAWDKYAKVAAHADAEALLRQIPAPAASLLVCELIFMRGSGRYLWRFEQALRIFADFRALGRPMDTPLEFSLYLRALNRLGKHRLVIHEVAQYGARAQHLADACLPVAIMRQVVAAYFRGNRPDRAMGVFNDMRHSEHYRGAITPHVYTTVLRGALMAGRLPDTELLVLVDELLDVLQQPDY